MRGGGRVRGEGVCEGGRRELHTLNKTLYKNRSTLAQ